MGDEDVLEVVRQLEKAFNASDWKAYSALLTDNTVIETPSIQGRGPEDVLQNARHIKEAYPDMRTTITNGLSCGHTAVVELAVVGTHTGPIATPRGPIPPTNRKVAFKTAMLVEISNGKVMALRRATGGRRRLLASLPKGSTSSAVFVGSWRLTDATSRSNRESCSRGQAAVARFHVRLP